MDEHADRTMDESRELQWLLTQEFPDRFVLVPPQGDDGYQTVPVYKRSANEKREPVYLFARRQLRVSFGSIKDGARSRCRPRDRGRVDRALQPPLALLIEQRR